MALKYLNLDSETRKYMLDELAITERADQIYLSRYLSEQGVKDWVPLLREGCASGSDAILAQKLSQNGRLRHQIEKRKPKGGTIMADVPYDANDTLAEGQFNRLYIRAICRRVLESGGKTVRVYRAAERENERTASKALVDTDLEAAPLLEKLRNALDFESGFPEPNTGLTVTLV